MSIIKANDFAKIQQNELTLTELKEKELVEKNYDQARFRIKETLIKAERSPAYSPQEEIQLLRENINLAKDYFSTSEKEIQRLRAELAGDKGVQRLQNEIDSQARQLTEQNRKITDLQAKLQEQTAKNTELQNVQKENMNLRCDLDKAAVLATEQNLKINNLQTMLQEQITKNAELQNSRNENLGLRHNLEKAAARETDLLKQIEDLKDTNVLLTKENTALNNDKSRAVQEMNHTISSYSAEQEKNIQLEYKFKRAEQEFRDIQNQLQEARETIAAVENLVSGNLKNKNLAPPEN